MATDSPDPRRLWAYLSSWLTEDGGVNGPVIHRNDLKRLFFVHDTPWTQAPCIEGLIHLYNRTGETHWLQKALKLADSQCTRQQEDGSFRWAGHEDDRFSSLVHNALADCALLAAAETASARGMEEVCERYVAAVTRNISQYWMNKLYDPQIGGFAMNPIDYYYGVNRFIVNMNSVACEAMIRLDMLTSTNIYADLAASIGDGIVASQCRSGPGNGAFAYSNIQPDCFITIYTALAMRGLPWLYRLTGDQKYVESAALALYHIETLRDKATGLWCHKMEGGRLFKYPLFVSGAGMICNGILDAAQLSGQNPNVPALRSALAAHQYSNGAVRNFIGYDHPDNNRERGIGRECWEDAVPTPNWNAWAFLFSARVGPTGNGDPSGEGRWRPDLGKRHFYFEGRHVLLVAGWSPFAHAFLGIYHKRHLHGLAISLNKIKILLSMILRRYVKKRAPRNMVVQT